jgi:hypothetical protein
LKQLFQESLLQDQSQTVLTSAEKSELIRLFEMMMGGLSAGELEEIHNS